METMTLTAAMNELTQALAVLENAKEDFNDVVGSTFDAYFGEIVSEDKNVVKSIKAERKTAKKNMLKLARALMKDEEEVALKEADNMRDLIESL